MEIGHIIGCVHNRRNGQFCKVGNSSDSSKLHGLIDGCRTTVKGTTENVGEAEDIVDLVGIIAAACCKYDIGTGLQSQIIGNFRIGVGEREYNGFRSH